MMQGLTRGWCGIQRMCTRKKPIDSYVAVQPLRSETEFCVLSTVLYTRGMVKKVTNEELARMIAKGFENTATKDDIKRLDGRMDHMDARLGRIEADVAEIRGNLVYKDEFEDLMARVKYLEIKAGIDSGK